MGSFNLEILNNMALHVHEIFYSELFVFFKSIFCIMLIKGKLFYTTVSSLQDCSKHFTLYFPGRPVQSSTISISLGSIHSQLTLFDAHRSRPQTILSSTVSCILRVTRNCGRDDTLPFTTTLCCTPSMMTR